MTAAAAGNGLEKLKKLPELTKYTSSVHNLFIVFGTKKG